MSAALLYRVASIVVFVIAMAAMLLQFEVVRSIGTSLLASAGIAGITIGLAAQKSLGAIIAGIQISIAQPVRIGDTVVVDTQQGVVEEIHLTYIVLRLADDPGVIEDRVRAANKERNARVAEDVKRPPVEGVRVLAGLIEG